MKKISRREILKGIGAAGAALAAPQMLLAQEGKRAGKPANNLKKKAWEEQKANAAAAFDPSRKRPNIVFIMADQLAASWVGCYGSGVNSTPTLDRLANEGVRFTRCITHAPGCAPNRASIFTGRSLEIHGMVANNLRLQTDNPLFTQLLKTNGYRTGGFGKFHFTEMTMYPHEKSMKRYGFDEAVETEDPKFGAWLEWIAHDHPEILRAGPCPLLASTLHGRVWPSGARQKGPPRRFSKGFSKAHGPTTKGFRVGRMFTSPLPRELQQSVFITDCSLDFIKRHREKNADQPYFCYISYVQPHDPYDPPKPYDTMFDPHDMKLPVPMVGDHYTCKLMESWRDTFNYRAIEHKPDIVRKFRSYYHGNVRLIDDQIGRLMKYLKESGQMDNTIIVFTTDHGEFLGDHGLVAKWAAHYDSGIRCPLIVHGPGIAKGVVSDRLTSALDFFPTMCDLAGMDLRPPLEGKSFFSTCEGKPGDKGWPVMTVQLGAVRSIMTNNGWRLTHFDQEGEGQIFNLREDPDEQRNLYHAPEAVKRRLELEELFARTILPLSGRVTRYNNLPQKDGHRCLFNPGYTEFIPLPWEISSDMRGPGVV